MSWATGLSLLCALLIAIWAGAEVWAAGAMRRRARRRAILARYCESILERCWQGPKV